LSLTRYPMNDAKLFFELSLAKIWFQHAVRICIVDYTNRIKYREIIIPPLPHLLPFLPDYLPPRLIASSKTSILAPIFGCPLPPLPPPPAAGVWCFLCASFLISLNEGCLSLVTSSSLGLKGLLPGGPSPSGLRCIGPDLGPVLLPATSTSFPLPFALFVGA
jgi:hypothetical protein